MQDRLGEDALPARVGAAAHAELEEGLLEVDHRQELDDALVELLRAGGARRRVVDPVGVDVERAIAGARGLVQLEVAAAPGLLVIGRLAQRPVLQAVDDVVAHRSRKEIRRHADVGKRAAGHRLGRAPDVQAAHLERARGRRHQPRQHLRELRGAARRAADDRNVVPHRALERHAVDQARAGVVEERERRDSQPPVARQCRRLERRLQLGRRHLLVGELLDHLRVLDLDVHPLLVPIDQLLHRAGQILVGSDHRDQGTDVEAADDHQIAADGVEEKRRHLREEVVQELHHELALVELKPDAEDLAQARRDLGALVVGGVVRMDLGGALDTLGDAPGERPRGELALAAELELPAPQARNDERLDRHHAERDQAKPDLLVEDEEHGRERLPAEEERRDQRLADEAAERLDLVLDHGRHLGGLDAPEARQRKAQDVVEQGIAQPPQHALAHPALHGVDLELEPADGDDQREKRGRQGEKVGNALEIEAEEVLDRVRRGEAHALDRLVDDGLRQVERQVVHHHRRDHQRHDQELIALAVLDNEAEETAFHLENFP